MSRQSRLPRPFGQALALRSPPLCPELQLWLIADGVDLEAECRALHDGESPPYWAFCWGSGQALARWLLDHPEEVRGRRVVDFGCGSGVAGIAAARAGAQRVTAIDIDLSARQVTLANAAANGIPPETLDATAALPEAWDLLLASDVLYEPTLHPILKEIQQRAEQQGATILAAEPDRPGNPGHPANKLEHYEVQTFPDVDSPTQAATLYRLATTPQARTSKRW